MATKTNKHRPLNKKMFILWGSVTILLIACTTLLIASLYITVRDGEKHNVSLGGLQYRIDNNTAVKRTDSLVTNLRIFLENKASKENCPMRTVAFEHVIAATKDESQILLNYGCGSADSPMYIVRSGSTWKSLSPTNQFNILGIPACHYVTENKISPEIAPVCQEPTDTVLPPPAPKYRLRS